jgi:hypothetical protein
MDARWWCLGCAAGLMACVGAPTLPTEDPFPEDALQDQARVISLGHEVVDRVGPGLSDRRDWKRFEVRQRADLEITLKPLAPNRQLQLDAYHADGLPAGTLISALGAPKSLRLNAAQGLFYVSIEGDDDASPLGYVLLVDTVEPTYP